MAGKLVDADCTYYGVIFIFLLIYSFDQRNTSTGGVGL